MFNIFFFSGVFCNVRGFRAADRRTRRRAPKPTRAACSPFKCLPTTQRGGKARANANPPEQMRREPATPPLGDNRKNLSDRPRTNTNPNAARPRRVETARRKTKNRPTRRRNTVRLFSRSEPSVFFRLLLLLRVQNAACPF